MTEKIMIDGVDVAGCEFLQEEEGEYTCYAEEGSTCAFVACSACANCYYKQLARKTEECEKLKEKNEALIILGKDLASAYKTDLKDF